MLVWIASVSACMSPDVSSASVATAVAESSSWQSGDELTGASGAWL